MMETFLHTLTHIASRVLTLCIYMFMDLPDYYLCIAFGRNPVSGLITIRNIIYVYMLK